MFTFPQIDPETSGRVTKMPVPLDKFLSSSFDQGQHDSAFNSIMRMEELHLDNVDETSPMLDPVTANLKYGVGDLKFDQPIRQAAAATMSDRKKYEMDRQYALSQGSSAARFLPGIAASILGGVSNPLDLGLMFVPFVGEERAATLVGKAGGSRLSQMFARGLITQESIAAAKIPVPRLVGAAVQGTLNQSLFEIPNLIASTQDKADYTASDALRNIVGGGVFAAAIHSAGAIFKRLSRGTTDAMNQEALNQFLRDEDIRVEKYVQLDEESIRNNVKFDEDLARKQAVDSIDESKLKQAIFDTYHEQPKQAAVMIISPDGTSEIHTGSFHGDAWGHASKEDFEAVGSGKKTAVEGFTTDTGRFVSRDEAAQLVGLPEHLIAEGMHGQPADSEIDLLHSLMEEGKSRSDAMNELTAQRIEQQRKFFFDRPDIQEKMNAERERQINDFVEKQRADHDPETQFTKAAHAEISRQQAEGRILTQDQINKYVPADKPFEEQSAEMLTKDVQNLKENLTPQEKVEGKEVEQFTESEKKLLEDLPKAQSNAVDAAADCLLKQVL